VKRTFKLKVELDETVGTELFQQAEALYNYYTTWAKKVQSWNKKKCHKQTYSALREEYPKFPSALLQTVRDNALESCKQCKLKTTPRKKTNSITYDARTMRLRGNYLWLSSTQGRQKLELKLCKYHETFLVGKLISGILLKKTSGFFVALVFELPTPEKIEDLKTFGVDRGVYNIAVTSDGEFHSSSKIRSNKRRNLYNKRKLQAKGTKSAKKKLRLLSGKEMRFSRDINHVISKKKEKLIPIVHNNTNTTKDLSQPCR
jgi:transposase